MKPTNTIKSYRIPTQDILKQFGIKTGKEEYIDEILLTPSTEGMVVIVSDVVKNEEDD